MEYTMKKLNLYLLAIMMMTIPVLQSCDDDGYSLGDFVVRMATVRVTDGNSYYLEIDNGKTLWPAATDIPWYKPVDGQRTLANYTLLSDNFQGYDHAVKVNYLSNVLTKPVETLTAENEEEYGNDPAYIEQMWVGGNYLNVQFVFNVPYGEAHRVSLVRNTTGEDNLIDDEGYVHLEYRYNNQDDMSGYRRRSFVSFNLGEYGPQTEAQIYVKGIKVKINSIVNGEKEIVFDYESAEGERTLNYTSDVVNEGTR